MSIFIRDTENTSGTTPEDGQSPNVNPDFVGRTDRDTLSNLGANSNPDFISRPRRVIGFRQTGVPLTIGWNFITYTGTERMHPSDYCKLLFPYLQYSGGVDNKLSSVMSIMKDLRGLLFWPAISFNSLGDLIPGNSYYLHIRLDAKANGFIPGIVRPNIASAENIELPSDYINKLNNIEQTVDSGWNFIGYNRISPRDIRSTLYGFFFPTITILPTNIDGRLQKLMTVMKDLKGNIYWPEIGFNALGNFRPGEGMMIHLNEDEGGEITFPFTGKLPPANDIDPRPLIEGGPE
tara:strand:+ start:360 stop:1235 length:876 start_codon:yes stop_codon:yes gene_type:complete